MRAGKFKRMTLEVKTDGRHFAGSQNPQWSEEGGRYVVLTAMRTEARVRYQQAKNSEISHVLFVRGGVLGFDFTRIRFRDGDRVYYPDAPGVVHNGRRGAMVEFVVREERLNA